MSTYKQIAGTTVKAYTTNPSDPQEGEMWYNQTTLKLRGVTALAAWSSAAPLAIARYGNAGSGTQTAGLSTGGNIGPSDTRTTATEEYNGSGFSTGGALPTATRSGGAAGTQTATIYAGGYDTANTAEAYTYDGSSWTGIPALNTARRSLDQNMAGTTTAAIIAGGFSPPAVNNSEEYNGSSWSEGNNLNTARSNCAAGGVQTASFLAGGGTPTASSSTELYDGTSWTASGNLNTARSSLSGGGSQTAGIVFGGSAGPNAQTETFDGTAWTETADMATARYGGAPANQPGAQSSTFVAGGYTGTQITGATEEFNVSAQVITAAAWSSGGNLSTGRQRAGGFGNAQNSAVVAAGATAPPASALSATEEYDGSAWSSGGSVNTARFNMTAFGTETAGVLAGKGTPSVPYAGTTEEYNGSSWTTVSPYSSPYVNYRSSCGPETAGLLAGGVRAPGQGEFDNVVEEYDGSTWTSGTALPQYQSYNNQAGTQTAAINGGGSAGPAAPGPVTANTISLEYDGTNWTTAPNANLASPTQVRSFNGGTGTQSDAMFAGGDVNLNGIRYDGTTFKTDAAYPAARGETSAAGLASASNSILFAGAPVPSVGNTTVEYSGETTAANTVDITTAE